MLYLILKFIYIFYLHKKNMSIQLIIVRQKYYYYYNNNKVKKSLFINKYNNYRHKKSEKKIKIHQPNYFYI